MTYAPDGSLGGSFGVSAARKPERFDRARGRLADAALAYLPLAVAVVDQSLQLLYWNAQAAALWGRPPMMAAEQPSLSDMVGAMPALSAAQRQRIISFCEDVVVLGDRAEPESWLRIALTRDSRLAIQVRGMGHGRWLITLNDGRGIAAERKGSGQDAGDAWLDALTGLRNRRHFQQLLIDLFDDPQAAATHAVLLIDITGLQAINDAIGRSAGDALLSLVARRLERVLREDDLLARVSGDEFAILVPNGAAAATLAGRVVSDLSQPFLIEGQAVRASVGIGIARLTDAAGSTDALMGQAASALGAAKQGGVNRWAVFDAGKPSDDARAGRLAPASPQAAAARS